MADAGTMYANAKALSELLQETKAENAKLRELVRDAHKTIKGLCWMVENSPGCALCPLNQDEDRACGAAEFFNSMLELGVEVDS